MRYPTLFLVLASASFVSAQGWEKLLTPGFSYRMEIDTRTPRVMHMLRWSPGAPGLSARAEIARMRMYTPSRDSARQEMSLLAKQAGAMAAINGDFFAANGDPIGVMVRDGELLSRPFPGRGGFAWGLNVTAFGQVEWSGSATSDTLGTADLTGLNEEVPATNGLVLFSDASAVARQPMTRPAEGSTDKPAPIPCTFVVLRMERGAITPTGITRGTVARVLRNSENLPIAQGEAVLAGTGPFFNSLNNLRPGERVTINMRTTGLDWSKVDNVIGGGPNLIRAGALAIDLARASFNDAFSTTRHPRTAIGRTAEGDLWFVTVDGRQEGISLGASLNELAQVMQRLGCTDAINLDGGGSTTLSVYGEVLNRPSDGVERRVANGILFFGPEPAKQEVQLAIQGPASLAPSTFQTYRLLGPDGKEIADREVLWSAMGPGGWVDQSGNARTLPKGGAFTIRAYYRGQVARLQVTVATPAPAAPTTPPR